MDTSTPRTATQVIEGVRTAREQIHQGEITQLQLAVEWALLHPCREEHADEVNEGNPHALTPFAHSLPRWS